MFFPIFGLWVKYLALLDLKFGFCMQKSSHGTPPELIWLDSGDFISIVGFFEMFEMCFFLFFRSGSRIWHFLTSNSDLACKNHPMEHLLSSYGLILPILYRFSKFLKILLSVFFKFSPRIQGPHRVRNVGDRISYNFAVISST